jgi:hypothetical protein
MAIAVITAETIIIITIMARTRNMADSADAIAVTAIPILTRTKEGRTRPLIPITLAIRITAMEREAIIMAATTRTILVAVAIVP